jgi:hypothetical protein
VWVFLNNAFLSVVQCEGEREQNWLMIRARLRGDIQTIFPSAKVTSNSARDYRWRAKVRRDEFAAAMRRAVEAIDYPNFKASVRDHQRHDTYLRVWGVMKNAQDEQARRERARTKARRSLSGSFVT